MARRADNSSNGLDHLCPGCRSDNSPHADACRHCASQRERNEIEREVETLRRENTELRGEVNALRERVAGLEDAIEAFGDQLAHLEDRIDASEDKVPVAVVDDEGNIGVELVDRKEAGR